MEKRKSTRSTIKSRKSSKTAQFFVEPIIQESDAVLKKLGDIPEKQEYLETTYRLRKLLQLRQCIENENYYYLQRVQ